MHHKIEWSTVPNLNEKLKSFRFDTIWKHIFAEEEKSLCYFYYLDFLRVSGHTYRNVTAASDTNPLFKQETSPETELSSLPCTANSTDSFV